jgi:hypothetical protein
LAIGCFIFGGSTAFARGFPDLIEAKLSTEFEVFGVEAAFEIDYYIVNDNVTKLFLRDNSSMLCISRSG